MIFKQETIKSWFTGVGSSINNEVVQPFQYANSIISKYNLAIQHNSLTQQGWQRLLAQSDDSLKAYLTSIKGTTASMSGYNVSLQGNITGFTKITKAMQQYNALGATSQNEQQAFATAVGATNSKLGLYLTGLNGAKASLSGYGLSLIASTAKTIGLTVATSALNATLTMGISLIVSGLISAFVSWIHKSEEITEKAQEAADKINSINDSLKSNTETVENAKKRYAELAQEVENLGKITQSQGTLSNEEYEEFLDLSNQLAGIFPSLTKNYDTNGNAILDLSGDVNTIVSSLDDLIQKEKELANQKIIEEFPDVFKGWNQDLSDAEQKVKSAKTEFDKINQAYRSLEKGQSIQMGFNVNGSNIDTNGKLTTIGQYEGWLKDLGLTYEETVVAGGKVVTATGDIDTAFTSKLEKAREDLQYAQQQLEGQTSSINQYLNTWLQGEFSYIQIEDSGLRTAIQDMLFNFDWDNIPEDKRGDWNYVSEYLRRNILFEINKVQDDPVISKAISEVFTNTELTPDEKSNYLQQIRDFFGEKSAVVISLKPQIEETETLQKQYDKAIEDTKKKFNGYDPTAFFKEHSINTQEEIDAWQEIAQGARDAAEAEKEYIQSSTSNIENPISFDQTWTNSFTSENDKVKELANNLLELAEKGHLTKESFAQTDSTNYFKNLGISADEAILKINKLVDESKQLSSMASQLSSISDALGIKRDDGFVSADTLAGFDVEVRGLDSWDRFQEVLGSTASSYGECQEAANALATEWVNSSDFLAQLTEKNKKYYETQLQAMGVENYEEVIAYAQELNSAKEALAQAGFDVATATEEEIQALIKEGTYSELAQQQIWNLVLTKQAEKGITLDTSADCQNLLALAQNAGITGTAIELLAELLEIYNNLAAGTYGTNAQVINAVKNKAESLKNQINAIFANGVNSDTVELDPEIKVGSSASKAGKAAGDTYVEAFDEELKSLQELRDRGVIDESDYLQRLRALYTRYFADRKEYINQYNEYERQYLDGMKSLYDSALSGVSKLMSHQIDGYTEAKEAAVASLEAEKEARLEAIEAQKEQLEAEQDLIDERIDAKQELIDGIQKEIDAMKDARAERQRQLDLQKAQYELESMKNQRTILLYSREKGMHYVADDSAVRDAQEKVDDAKFDIEVSQKEKEIKLIEQEIDLLEEQKEAIQEQIDALDGQAERIEEYYSKMISETEKYYDSLISNTEKQKARWEELAEVEEIAQAYSAMKQVFGDMGYTVQDILNGNEQAFEDFKSKYVSLLSDMNNNANFAEGLSYATGISEESLGSFLDKTKEAGAGIDELSSKSSSLGVVAEGMDGIASSASNVNTLVSDEQAAFDSLRQTIANVIDAIDQKTQAMLNEQVVTGIAVTTEIAYFTLLKEKILELQECISNINLAVMTLDRTPIDNLADAFRCLYDQILLVSTTLGIGGKNQGTSALGSITSALQALNEISLEEGIITQLANLQTAIIGVASAISGSGGEAPDSKGNGKSASLPGGKADGKSTGGKGGSNSLTDAITQMGTTAGKVIGEPDAEGDGTVIGEFGSLKTAVTDVTTSIGNGDSKGTEEPNNDSADEGDGTLIDSIVSLGDTTKEVLGEPGGEGVIGRFEQFKQPISEADDHVQSIARGLEDIDGQNVECTIKIHVESDGPLPGDGILKSTMNTGSGEYTADYGSTPPTKQTTSTITTLSGLKLQPIRPGDSAWALQEAFAPLLREMNHHLAASAMYEQRRQTEQMIRDITAASMIYNNKNLQPAIHGGVHITCPGVTSQEVARQVGAELNHMFNGLHNYADQQSSVR